MTSKVLRVSKRGVSEDLKAFGLRPWEHRGGIFRNEGCRRGRLLQGG